MAWVESKVLAVRALPGGGRVVMGSGEEGVYLEVDRPGGYFRSNLTDEEARALEAALQARVAVARPR